MSREPRPLLDLDGGPMTLMGRPMFVASGPAPGWSPFDQIEPEGELFAAMEEAMRRDDQDAANGRLHPPD